MEKKFYALVAILCFLSFLSVRAQDSTACNPGFSAFASGDTANFNAWDTLSNIQHSWRFGDGTSLSFSRRYSFVQHHFPASGSYTVTHIIRDSLGGGCFDSSSQVVVINAAPTCSIDFNASVDSLIHPGKYSFFAFPTGPADTVRWYINDTLVATADSLLNYSLLPGTYSVCVNLHSSSGCIAQNCHTIVVRDSSDTSHVLPPPPPPTCTVSFSYTFSPSQPNAVHFMAHDSTGLDSVSLTWFIFRSADTVVLHGPDPIYVFSDTGCYRVQLFAVSPSGCSSFTEQQVCIDSLSGNGFVACYPNPTPGQTCLDLRMDEDNTVYVNIFNSMGHLVISKRLAGLRGLNHFILPTADLPKGVYYVQVQFGGVTKRCKIQKL
jgi:hypothetical protein